MDKPRKILIIQLKRAGDVIVTTPVLAALRQALPQTQIDFLVDKAFAPLLENNPALREIRIYDRAAFWKTWKDVRAASYDWILDFQSSPRSILTGLLSGASVRAGYQVTFWGKFFTHAVRRPGDRVPVTEGKMTLARAVLPEAPQAAERRIYLTAQESDWAKQQIGERQRTKGAIGLIPTHRRASRRWHASSFAELARRLVSDGHPVWLFWGPGEKEYVSMIQAQAPEAKVIPSSSLRQMAALLAQCEAVVANDNGPMHLAVAVGTPTLTVYGPTDPVVWNPGGQRHRILRAEGLTCLGCNLNGCPFGHECMSGVTPDQVFAHAQEILKMPMGAAG